MGLESDGQDFMQVLHQPDVLKLITNLYINSACLVIKWFCLKFLTLLYHRFNVNTSKSVCLLSQNIKNIVLISKTNVQSPLNGL